MAKKDDEDVYITVLKFGRSKGLEGASWMEVVDHVRSTGHITEDEAEDVRERSRESPRVTGVHRIFNEAFGLVGSTEGEEKYYKKKM